MGSMIGLVKFYNLILIVSRLSIYHHCTHTKEGSH